MNVKELRTFLDREESLWTADQQEYLGDFELTPVVIDTLTCYSEMEGMYLGEISTIVLYPAAGAKVETHVPLSPIGCPAWGEMEDL